METQTKVFHTGYTKISVNEAKSITVSELLEKLDSSQNGLSIVEAYKPTTACVKDDT
jgi:hypothetical protein